MFSFEGFSCSMLVLYGGLGISKLQVSNRKKKFIALNFFQLLAWILNWIRIDQKCWIRIRIEINADPQH